MTKTVLSLKVLLILAVLIVSLGCHQDNQPARSSTPPTEEKEAVYTGGIKANLTAEEAKEAIKWGAKNKDSYKVIARTYKFGNPKLYNEFGLISTRFYLLADHGYRTVREGKSPERSEIYRILTERTFRIYIFTYGDTLDFADSYHVVLKQGEKIIQPVNVMAGWWVDKTPRFPKSPSYKATVLGMFPYSEIDPKGKATIILIKDPGESRFEVDFSHYK